MGDVQRGLGHGVLLLMLALYTAFAAGPFAWTAMLSVRRTSDIMQAPFAWPEVWRWDKYVDAWVGSNYATYFSNSVIIVVTSVALVTIIGAAAAHALARYRFPGNRIVYFLIFSTIIFPPQITVLALFQTLVDFNLFNTRTGLILVYVASQLPLTVFLLEGFFARLPQELFDAARMDGYSEAEIFWRITLPVGLPAIATTIILNVVHLWNEFLYAVVLISDDDKRTLPLGVQKFLGDRLEDIGMLATGMMIAVAPIIIVYLFFSERLIRSMTAGAVK
ncbi:MAG TPA: carbohydrate ABC transporter permease [Aestuariivirgaceae bacterium]|nr:carbohydrate ABC transporter permease [Aestuariivirgaceae bacterium]